MMMMHWRSDFCVFGEILEEIVRKIAQKIPPPPSSLRFLKNKLKNKQTN